MVAQSQESTTLSDQKSSGGTEGEETRKVVSRGAVSPGQRTCSHVISNTGCHPKCRIRTTVCRADNVLVVSKFASFHEFIRFRKQIKVAWGQVWRIQWV